MGRCQSKWLKTANEEKLNSEIHQLPASLTFALGFYTLVILASTQGNAAAV